MKKFIKYFLLVILVLPLLFLSSCNDTKKVSKLFFDEPLDKIEYYEIKVDPRSDGTLDMRYSITWRVLNDDLEGPLTWVKIGIPNCYVNEIKGLTSNISEIDYYSDEGSYIRIDFDRSYYANETLTFKFSFHQERMYHLDGNNVYYNFVPGWFEEIQVEQIKVLWSNENVINSNHNKVYQERYLMWNFFNLDYNESIDVDVTYNKDSFLNLSEDLQYSDRYTTDEELLQIFLIIGGMILFTIIMVIVIVKNTDPYMSNRGFIGRTTHSHRYYHYHHYYTGGVNRKGVTIVNPNSSSGGVSGGSSCACACACAGGGRAGCSRKDFNHHSVDVKKVIDKLNEKDS